MTASKKYKAIVIGSSAGGLHALKAIFKRLDSRFRIPMIIVQHMSPDAENYLVNILNEQKKLRVKEADEKEYPAPGFAYVAPPNYHLLMESDQSFTLTVDERVNYARPSIYVLFETAAEAYRDNLVGIILTGANNDGSRGLKKIKDLGGITVVQDPNTAEVNSMPLAAIQSTQPDHILSLEDIALLLNTLDNP